MVSALRVDCYFDRLRSSQWHARKESPQQRTSEHQLTTKRIHEVQVIAIVALGGIAGSLSRWAVSLGIVDHGFPWATLLVNYIGSVILMALLLYVKHHKSPKWWWRPALGAGFCGGFTTYSAFALKVDQYISHNNFASAMEYTLASIIGTYILIFATNAFYKVRFLK